MPEPELIDNENHEWTDEDFARAIPFSALPKEMQGLLLSPKRLKPDEQESPAQQPAA